MNKRVGTALHQDKQKIGNSSIGSAFMCEVSWGKLKDDE